MPEDQRVSSKVLIDGVIVWRTQQPLSTGVSQIVRWFGECLAALIKQIENLY
jgi:hypothetical protein